MSLFVTWHHWPSPYGPLFTLLTYPVGGLPLSLAYWVMKTTMVLLSAGLIVLVWRCALSSGTIPGTPSSSSGPIRSS